MTQSVVDINHLKQHVLPEIFATPALIGGNPPIFSGDQK